MGMTAILVMWPAELFSTNPFDHQKESPYEIGSSFDPVVCKVYQQTSVVQAHISHEISGFAFSDIKEKWNTTKLTSSNIMRSLSIHCLFTHWHLKLYKKINKKCEFNILVLVLLVTRSVCRTFYIFLLFVLYVTWWGMWNPFLYIFSFWFICYEVGMWNPFLYVFSFCFICYEVGMLNPFYIV